MAPRLRFFPSDSVGGSFEQARRFLADDAPIFVAIAMLTAEQEGDFAVGDPGRLAVRVAVDLFEVAMAAQAREWHSFESDFDDFPMTGLLEASHLLSAVIEHAPADQREAMLRAVSLLIDQSWCALDNLMAA
jgi:hypothetical protein